MEDYPPFLPTTVTLGFRYLRCARLNDWFYISGEQTWRAVQVTWKSLAWRGFRCDGEELWQQKSESESRSVVSDPLRPHGLYSAWNSLGQNTGMGSLSLLQWIFPTQGSNPGLPHCRQILYQLSPIPKFIHHGGGQRYLSKSKNWCWWSLMMAGGLFMSANGSMGQSKTETETPPTNNTPLQRREK